MKNITFKGILHARWKIIIGILALLGVGSWFAYGAISNSWKDFQLIQRGQITIGYITDTWEDYEPTDSGGLLWFYGGTYTYQLPDGREFQGELEGDRLFKSEFYSLAQDYPVEVTYLPDNPDISLISAEVPDNVIWIFRISPERYIFAILFLSLGFYLLWHLIRELKRAQLD